MSTVVSKHRVTTAPLGDSWEVLTPFGLRDGGSRSGADEGDRSPGQCATTTRSDLPRPQQVRLAAGFFTALPISALILSAAAVSVLRGQAHRRSR